MRILLHLCLIILSVGGIFSCVSTEQEENIEDNEPLERPEENRFSKIVLVENLDEPMELYVLDNGKVLFIERKGKVKLYNPETKAAKEVGKLNVFPEYEDGLLGLTVDPDFNRNNYIYLYYAPVGAESINRLSRFLFKKEQLVLSSEKIMLEIPVVRACCHSGGSLAFGPDKNLYISLGDDTNPFQSDNYNPIDERPGRSEPWDAQRSASNSNDLRGKILRIRPQPDGSYTIPKGNLFPPGTPNARSEIYIMGNRNPFRISLDEKTGFLYWGEVGPDAATDSIGRGPKGHDEINQAREAGFFGWPYFIADNKPYWDFNFETNKSKQPYNPDSIVNNSPNNSGVKKLPSAKEAFIWYSYTESEVFPILGEGGRNAMAGPVFYHDLYSLSDVKFPRYYHGKLFIYDWMRNWIMAVNMDKDGDFQAIEKFMPSTVFDKPMDMQFGKDGALYVLEYGTFWNSQNEDARLSRIEFSEGNRKPIVRASVNKTSGATPAKFEFSSKGSFDYDLEDQLRYEWSFDQAGVVQSTEENPEFTFQNPGVYKPTLKVIDLEGKEAIVELEVRVGNEPPVIIIETSDNQSFYWEKTTISYQVKVTDKEDGCLADGRIHPDRIKVTLNYLSQGSDIIEATEGHQIVTSANTHQGKLLMDGSDCNACHALDKTSVGPSYRDIALRYTTTSGISENLVSKVLKGGGGAWGDREMPAHPQLDKAEAEKMISYILSLSENEENIDLKSLPLNGKLNMEDHLKAPDNGIYTLIASYTDEGGEKVGPITSRAELRLRHAKTLAATADGSKGAAKANNKDSRLIKFTEDSAYIKFNKIDLKDIKHVIWELDPNNTKGKIELRLDSPDGKIIATTEALAKNKLDNNSKEGRWFKVKSKVEPTPNVHDIYIVYRSQTDEGQEAVSIWNSFLLNSIYFGKDR